VFTLKAVAAQCFSFLTTIMANVPVSIDNAKCVLVIGATSGIGRALALAISELPSRPTVIAAGRRQDRLKELQEKNLETVQLDVAADLKTLKKTVDSLIAKYPNVRDFEFFFDSLLNLYPSWMQLSSRLVRIYSSSSCPVETILWICMTKFYHRSPLVMVPVKLIFNGRHPVQF
jgi:hypothetical protein